MITHYKKIFFSLLLTFLFASAGLQIASAQEITPAPQAGLDCATCHSQFHVSWENGAHGQASSNSNFVNDWTSQGKPGACLVCHTTGYDPETATWAADGVTCQSCHSPISSDHPKTPMPVIRTTDLCGSCHSSTHFGLEEWQTSKHYQSNMSCVVCHDPHSGSLKEPSSPNNTSGFTDASSLCVTCHAEASKDFPETVHHNRGLTCVNCHIYKIDAADKKAHTLTDHNFNASIENCNACHTGTMHSNGKLNDLSETQVKTASLNPLDILTTPEQVSPFGYAVLAGLLGLGGGMVLAPRLERWYRLVSKNKGGRDE